ncbi:hypothetical protein RclHR1_00010032 [Rhizophagus clarus]|uniref:CCHC-type domain-containing protein n=1 Tax=Rhizophagus clarus TaxID=94130 RepID=A0A2Z6Q086_9GLOM|nr:hypothetical protein RclHR1_00010032 [Rhizophagus clarus]
MFTVYILKCNDEKYYVGKTTGEINDRYLQHCSGYGAEWTRIYRPVKIFDSFQTDNVHLLSNITLDYMKIFGIDNVRGDEYSKVTLSAEEENNIRRLLSFRNVSCYKCGISGHFINDCDFVSQQSNDNYREQNICRSLSCRNSWNGSYGRPSHNHEYYNRDRPNHFVNECNHWNSLHRRVECCNCSRLNNQRRRNDYSYECYNCDSPQTNWHRSHSYKCHNCRSTGHEYNDDNFSDDHGHSIFPMGLKVINKCNNNYERHCDKSVKYKPKFYCSKAFINV